MNVMWALPWEAFCPHPNKRPLEWVLLTEGERIRLGSVYLGDEHASPTVPAAEASSEMEQWVIRQVEGTSRRHGPNPRQLASLQEDMWRACQAALELPGCEPR